MAKKTPNRRTVAAAIRGSVPQGKLRKAKIVMREDTAGMPIGGFTEYDRGNGGDVVKIGVPVVDTAFGITIRGHETRHASIHKPTRRKPMTENESVAAQIVDDVNDETLDLPPLNSGAFTVYKRAHLATAMRDVRTITNKARKAKRGEIPDNVALRNSNLLASVRSLAMLSHYAKGEAPLCRVRDRGYAKVREAIGHRTFKALGQVIRQAEKRRTRAKAISMLVALMENEPDLESIEGEEMPDPHGEILAPVTHGDALDGHMRLIDLRPKTVYCAKEKSITRKHAPSGVIINAARYVSAIVSGDGNGLFSRRVRQKPGGCVVIDASGSMGATATNLSEICKLVPTATVGYYSGQGGGGRGDLCVYANGGKRFNGALPDEYMHYGNAVDLPAIRWMMQFPKPWILVSDLEFCGGVIGSEAVAHAIVERAVQRGDLTVYRSLDAAYEAFGGKGDLKNHPPEPM